MEGLKVKYNVFKVKDGTPVHGCFVLRPDKDPVATAALRAYAKATNNEALKEDIDKWVGSGEESTLSLNKWAKEIHRNAVDHGWWEEERSFGDIIALCHSELSEALEAFRNGEALVWDNKGKPDGVAIEMADCLIRILDWFGNQCISVEECVSMKHEYNKSRPYKHGGKRI